MQWIGIIILIWFVFRRKETVNNFYYQELSESDKIECERIVLRTLQQYHDAEVGELYPELVYEALIYRYESGMIGKEVFESELKKITDKIII